MSTAGRASAEFRDAVSSGPRTRSAANGLIDAFHGTLWIEAGILVVTAGLVALLPKRAREGGHA